MTILNAMNVLDLNETQTLRQYNVLADHVSKFNKLEGPRVGDFVRLPSGEYRRFCADWEDSLQITPTETCGSFNIDGGACDYSGTLEPSIPKSKLLNTHSLKLGRVWFFKDKFPAAHQGIDAMIPCRVFELLA